ncbi:hypothetical protein CAB17_16155 [Legionella sainthelensi]|uniref:Uncharacterized protein n=1 Tax=Legionella sainthelensi TaxID=28087 RepID=A0A2H5FPC8_9GAMM|nr:hypothetical protein CAB17_16155 [Legionella sainthelensi]
MVLNLLPLQNYRLLLFVNLFHFLKRLVAPELLANYVIASHSLPKSKKSSSSEQPGMRNTNSSSSENCPNTPLLEPGNVCDISLQDQPEENDMDLILSETANMRP